MAGFVHILKAMKLFVGPLLFVLTLQSQALAQANIQQLLNEKLYLHVKMEPSQKIIETDVLKELYQLNGYAPFWTESGKPNQAATILKNILLNANNWGLSSDQYLHPGILSLFDRLNERNAITLELLLSSAYVRFAQDLANGQILDPDLLDEDIKMPRKNFEDYAVLAEAAKKPEALSQALESLTPQHEKYQSLIQALRKLQSLQNQKSWGNLNDPQVDLRPGQKHPTIPEIKKRLHDLGYPVSNRTDVYDSELQTAAQRFQQSHHMRVTRTLSRPFFRSIQVNLQNRIDRIKANLEKYRWFPRHWDTRYLMVNLALQEMQIVENKRAVIEMKTVVGRPTRRTPTMRDEIRRVEFSPTWTVPFSIATKDKLPELQLNPYALEKLHIKIYDRNQSEIDPSQVNWLGIDRTNFYFTLVQQPGSHNALGLVKFPLSNPWFIYLHDTNEPWLMSEVDRLRSSGCIRLEDAFKVAEYLLQDQGYPVLEMKNPRSEPVPVMVRRPLPVYFLYQTVDVTSSGEIRFAQDEYGQDQRLIELFRSRGSREKF